MINARRAPIQDAYIERYLAEAEAGKRTLNLTATDAAGKINRHNPFGFIYNKVKLRKRDVRSVKKRVKPALNGRNNLCCWLYELARRRAWLVFYIDDFLFAEAHKAFFAVKAETVRAIFSSFNKF